MILLKEITRDNFWECIELTVSKDQINFVTSNAVSIAQAKVQPECIPLAVYDDDIMVGFVMYCIDEDDGEYWIYRMMIDEKYQSKGYGKAALEKLLEIIKEDNLHNKIFLGVHKESTHAVKLYKSFGFDFTGQVFGSEHIMRLNYNHINTKREAEFMENQISYLRIDGELVYIKEPTFQELDYVGKLWSDIKTTGEIGGPFRLKDKNQFFETRIYPGDGLNKYFLIYDKEDSKVGEVSFRKPDRDSKKAIFNMKIKWEHRGKGYAKSAMDLILDYYFNYYGGEIMEDDIAIDNTRAQRIFLNYGFEHVSTDKEEFFVRLTKDRFNEVSR